MAILVHVVDLNQNQASFFFATFDSLVVLTTRSDVYISKSGDFHADDDYLVPLAHARGVTLRIIAIEIMLCFIMHIME